jgi:hypothetical protein
MGTLNDGRCQTNPFDWGDRSKIGNENPVPLVAIFTFASTEIVEFGRQLRANPGQDDVLECAHPSIIGDCLHPNFLAENFKFLLRGIPCGRSFKIIVRRPTPRTFWGVDITSTGRKRKK